MAHFFLSSFGVHTVIYRHSIVDGHTHWVSRHAGMQVCRLVFACVFVIIIIIFFFGIRLLKVESLIEILLFLLIKIFNNLV